MKQLTILLSLFFIAFTACQKTETEWAPNASALKAAATPAPPAPSFISPVPARFTQKVLIEEFTSANEGLSPMGNSELENLVLPSNGKIIGVNIHTNDALASPMYNSLNDLFQVQHEIPSGMINRGFDNVTTNYTYSPYDWSESASLEMSKTASCGLAIHTRVTGNTASIDVHVGFVANIAQNLTANVYLIEHGLSGTGIGFDQINNFENDTRSNFYSMGNPIVGYSHNQVLREVLTASFGDAIATHLQSPGGEEIFKFVHDVSTYDINKTYVVAFITEQTSGSTIGKVLNVQSTRLNSTKNWD